MAADAKRGVLALKRQQDEQQRAFHEQKLAELEAKVQMAPLEEAQLDAERAAAQEETARVVAAAAAQAIAQVAAQGVTTPALTTPAAAASAAAAGPAASRFTRSGSRRALGNIPEHQQPTSPELRPDRKRPAPAAAAKQPLWRV